MTRKIRTIKSSLLQITYFTATIGAVMLVALTLSQRSLLETKGAMIKAQDIEVYLEKTAVNMGEITSAMRGYVLDNTLDGELQDRGIAHDSALGNLEIAKKNSFDPAFSAVLDQLTGLLNGKLAEMEDKFGQLAAKDAPAAKKFYFDEYVAQRQAFDATLNLARSKAKEASDNYNKRMNQILTFNGALMGGLLLLMVAAIVLLSLWIARSVNGRIGAITDTLTRSERRVGDASERLQTASEQLSAGATEAAASLEETMSSVEELSAMVSQNADSAREASGISLTARTTAENGESEVGRLVAAMSKIADSSRKIEEIIGVIDDIAFQTNLLALNAAVEAARAGEQGKGFAVVAEAVRTLAARSGSAAKDIAVLIKESTAQVETGEKVADSSGAVLKEIVTAIRRVSELNHQIAGASREQANGITQIASAMSQLDQATQTNAACAEHVSTASQQMSLEAEALEQQVDGLVAMIGARGVSHADADSQDEDSPAPAANVVPLIAPRRAAMAATRAGAKAAARPGVVANGASRF